MNWSSNFCEIGIPWYIMTSSSTYEQTKKYFDENNFFGLNPENVIFFQQSTLPCFTFSGEIVMKSKYQLARAPDGTGGLFWALKNEGILKNMERRGIEYVQLYCVDNILVKIGDPIFTGYCINRNAECGNKVVTKRFPKETVGVTCKVDGKYQVQLM